MWQWMTENSDALAIFIAFFGLAVPLISLAVSAARFIAVRQAENRQQRYENYHNLIYQLVQGREGQPYIDLQVAALFELGNYPEYRDVTLRILEGLGSAWDNSEHPPARLRKELELTIDKLKEKL